MAFGLTIFVRRSDSARRLVRPGSVSGSLATVVQLLCSETPVQRAVAIWPAPPWQSDVAAGDAKPVGEKPGAPVLERGPILGGPGCHAPRRAGRAGERVPRDGRPRRRVLLAR